MSNETAKPLARTADLVTKEVADEVLVYDLKTHQAHCLNQTAALVWKYCDGQTSTTTLAQVVSQDLNIEVKEELIWLALNQLSKSNLLAQQIAKPDTGVSRRLVLRKIGWTAVAVPLITSIIAPSALAGLTCVGLGPCTAGPTPTGLCACTGCCSNSKCVIKGSGGLNDTCTASCHCATSNSCCREGGTPNLGQCKNGAGGSICL